MNDCHLCKPDVHMYKIINCINCVNLLSDFSQVISRFLFYLGNGLNFMNRHKLVHLCPQ